MSLFNFKQQAQQQEEKTFDSWVTDLANKVSLKLLERGLSSSIVEYTEFVEMKDGSWGYQCPDLKDNKNNVD